jgi:hypothetical protein
MAPSTRALAVALVLGLLLAAPAAAAAAAPAGGRALLQGTDAFEQVGSALQQSMQMINDANKKAPNATAKVGGGERGRRPRAASTLPALWWSKQSKAIVLLCMLRSGEQHGPALRVAE